MLDNERKIEEFMEKKIVTDKHALYLASVQDPISDVERISKIFLEINKRGPISLREDFCGSFALSCCWVQSNDKHTALSLDLDQEVIDYGEKNYYANLSESEKERLRFFCQNSISVTEKVDLIATFNFSYCLLHERKTLVEYFKKCRESLVDGGLIMMDIFGGTESEIIEVQEREINNNDYIAPFVYEFERKTFNPISRRATYGIHFRYPNGPQLEDAFTYDFRMWTITELRDALEEAGFSRSLVYWEDCDEEGFGNGEYYQTESEDHTYNWSAYVVAQK
jgi:hypothetical protein